MAAREENGSARRMGEPQCAGPQAAQPARAEFQRKPKRDATPAEQQAILAQPQTPSFSGLCDSFGPYEANRLIGLWYAAHPPPPYPADAKRTGVCWSGLQ